jgi:hypothetical protein
MIYTDDFLAQVTNFGVLGYSFDRIVSLLDPAGSDEMKADFQNPGSVLFKAYQKGRVSGQYSLDRQLYDQATKGKNLIANEQLYNRIADEHISDALNEHFNLL